MFRKQSVITDERSMSSYRRPIVWLCTSFLLSSPVFAALQLEVAEQEFNINATVGYEHDYYQIRNSVSKVIDVNQVDYEHVFAGLSENINDDLGDGAQDYFVHGDSILVTSHDLTVNSVSSSFFMQGSANEHAITTGNYEFQIPFTITGETTLVYFSYDVLTSSHVNLDPSGILDLEIRYFADNPRGETRWETYRNHNTEHGPPSGQPIDETAAHTISLVPGDYSLAIAVKAGKHEGADSSYGTFYFSDTAGSVPQIPKAPISIDIQPQDADNYLETEGEYNDRVYVRAFSTQDENPSESVDFDASQIDPATLKLGITGAPVIPWFVQIVDFDDDGDDDFNAAFRVAQTGIVCDNPEANVELSGETYTGEQFVAVDYVTTPDCPSCHP
jgi:hypothetical protein